MDQSVHANTFLIPGHTLLINKLDTEADASLKETDASPTNIPPAPPDILPESTEGGSANPSVGEPETTVLQILNSTLRESVGSQMKPKEDLHNLCDKEDKTNIDKKVEDFNSLGTKEEDLPKLDNNTKDLGEANKEEGDIIAHITKEEDITNLDKKEEDLSTMNKTEKDFVIINKLEEDSAILGKKEEDLTTVDRTEEDLSILDKKDEDIDNVNQNEDPANSPKKDEDATLVDRIEKELPKQDSKDKDESNVDRGEEDLANPLQKEKYLTNNVQMEEDLTSQGRKEEYLTDVNCSDSSVHNGSIVTKNPKPETQHRCDSESSGVKQEFTSSAVESTSSVVECTTSSVESSSSAVKSTSTPVESTLSAVEPTSSTVETKQEDSSKIELSLQPEDRTIVQALVSFSEGFSNVAKTKRLSEETIVPSRSEITNHQVEFHSVPQNASVDLNIPGHGVYTQHPGYTQDILNMYNLGQGDIVGTTVQQLPVLEHAGIKEHFQTVPVQPHHADVMEDEGVQLLNVDGKLVKGILAYGDDGNQYVVPGTGLESNIPPFQVVDGHIPGTYISVLQQGGMDPALLSVIQHGSVTAVPYTVTRTAEAGFARSTSDLLQAEIADFTSSLPRTYINPQVVDLTGLVVSETIPLVLDKRTGQLIPQTSLYIPQERSIIEDQCDLIFQDLASGDMKRPVSKAVQRSVILEPNDVTSRARSKATTIQTTEGGGTNNRGGVASTLDKPKIKVESEKKVKSETSTAPAVSDLKPQDDAHKSVQSEANISVETSEFQVVPPVTSTSSLPNAESFPTSAIAPLPIAVKSGSTQSVRTESPVPIASGTASSGRRQVEKEKTVARVKPFSMAGKEEDRKIYSVLSSKAKSSQKSRKVSRVKCQCSNHMIIGYPPSEVYYWEVGTARGNSSLFLSFDNEGVKHLYDEEMLRAFQSALGCLRTEYMKTEVSLEVSICLTCVKWAENECTKKVPQQTAMKETVQINKTSSDKVKNEKVKSEPTNGKVKPDIEVYCDTVKKELDQVVETLVPKKERRIYSRRSLEPSSSENIYKKVYNNVRRSSTSSKEEETKDKTVNKKAAFFDLICEVPGCEKRVRSYNLLLLHFKNKHPTLADKPPINPNPGDEPLTSPILEESSVTQVDKAQTSPILADNPSSKPSQEETPALVDKLESNSDLERTSEVQLVGDKKVQSEETKEPVRISIIRKSEEQTLSINPDVADSPDSHEKKCEPREEKAEPSSRQRENESVSPRSKDGSISRSKTKDELISSDNLTKKDVSPRAVRGRNPPAIRKADVEQKRSHQSSRRKVEDNTTPRPTLEDSGASDAKSAHSKGKDEGSTELELETRKLMELRRLEIAMVPDVLTPRREKRKISMDGMENAQKRCKTSSTDKPLGKTELPPTTDAPSRKLRGATKDVEGTGKEAKRKSEPSLNTSKDKKLALEPSLNKLSADDVADELNLFLDDSEEPTAPEEMPGSHTDKSKSNTHAELDGSPPQDNVHRKGETKTPVSKDTLTLRNPDGKVLNLVYDESLDSLNVVPQSRLTKPKNSNSSRTGSNKLGAREKDEPKKTRLMKSLNIEMVPGTFSPASSRRSRNKVDAENESSATIRAKRSKTSTIPRAQSSDKTPPSSPEQSSKTTEASILNGPTATMESGSEDPVAADVLKDQRSFAKILFQRVVNQTVTACDAFTILKRRVRGLTFPAFEDEYRKFFKSRQNVPERTAKDVEVKVVDVLKTRNKLRKCLDRSSDLTEVPSDAKPQSGPSNSSSVPAISALPPVMKGKDNTAAVEDVLTELQLMESRLTLLLSFSQALGKEEREVVQRIRDLLERIQC